MATKQIPLGDVLSVTTGALVSRDHVGGVYNVCDWMTGEANMTHQLPRVGDLVRPAILAQHPELAEVETPTFDFPEGTANEDRKATVFAWLAEQEQRFGTMIELTPLSEYDAPNPVEELCDMVGPEKVYVWPEIASR